MSVANKKKQVASSIEKSQSTIRDSKTKKSGKQQTQKPIQKTVLLLSEKELPEPECLFPIWNLQQVNRLIEQEMTNWQNATSPEQTEAVDSAPGSKKQLSSKVRKSSVITLNASEDTDINTEIPTESVLEEPYLSQLQPYLKEWHSLQKKKKPYIVRKGFPHHPFFEELKKKKEISSAVEELESEDAKSLKRKSFVTNSRAKTRTPDPHLKGRKFSIDIEEQTPQDEVTASIEDQTIPIPDEETGCQFKEDFERYCEFVPLTLKGPWNEAFLEAVALIFHYRYHLELGSYLWERIYPKQEGSDYLPRVSQFGKYFVKLYFMGKERMVTIDDKLPQDRKGKILFCITQKKELWPALIMKALMRVSKG